jgi:hypothetical protein
VLYEARETVWAIREREEGHLEAMEVRAVVAMRSGAPMASRITPFAVCCCLAEEFLPPLVGTTKRALGRFRAVRDREAAPTITLPIVGLNR